MKISDEVLMSQVNNLALDIIKKLSRDKFRNIPIMFTGASDGTCRLPDVACVLSIGATDKLCDEIANAYIESLSERYQEEGDDMSVSAPNYDGIAAITKEDFDGAYQTGFSFYVINGEFYEHEADVVNKLEKGTLLVSKLLDRDSVAHCGNDKKAYYMLSDLRKKIGYSVTGYVDVRQFSEKQINNSQWAMAAALDKNWLRTLANVYDFLNSDGDHYLTNSEFGMLNLILYVVDSR